MNVNQISVKYDSVPFKLLASIGLAVIMTLTPLIGSISQSKAQSCEFWIAPGPAGNNANAGTALMPWATIDYASSRVLNLGGGNCTVWVKDGIYTGANDLSERFSAPVIFKAVNPYKAIVQNNGLTLEISGAANITFEGFEFRHSNTTPGPLLVYTSRSGGLWAENITFRNNIFHDSYNNDLLKIADGSRFITVEGNVFYNQGPGEQHMDVNSVTDITIQDNIFFNDFEGSGRANSKGTKHFIVIKDSNDNSDGLLGSQRITVRRNVFLKYQGGLEAFVQIGNDGKPYYEASDVRLENNLLIGNNIDKIGSVFGVSGVKNIAFINNSVVGNFPSSAFAYRIVIKGLNLKNQNIAFYNNIWSDPTGTMGADLSGGKNKFSSGDITSVSNLVLDNNLYWNGGAIIPAGDAGSPLVNDTHRVEGDPLLHSNQASIVLPRWNGSTFLSGNTTIRLEFLRLVNLYGQIPSSSPAIGKANLTFAPTNDILMQPRSTSSDLGAYENQAGAAPTSPPIVTAVPTTSTTPTPIVTQPAATSSITPVKSPTATLSPVPTTSILSPTPTPTNTVMPVIINTPTSAPTTLPQASDLIFTDGFESGGFSAWSSNTAGGGDLRASSSSALAGSNGMQGLINDTTAMYVSDTTPNAEPHYRARFYFDPNSITMAEGDMHTIFYGFSGSSSILRVDFRRSGGVYQLMARALGDNTVWAPTAWFTINDAPHAIEFDWQASSAVGANNGSLTFWLDNTLQASLTTIDNDTYRIDTVRLGLVTGLDTGTSGTEYFDAFESRRQTYIGLAAR